MADDEQRAVITDQALFNRFNGLKVKVVCRFVKQQKLRCVPAAKSTGQSGPDDLAAAQIRHRAQGRVGAKQEPRQRSPAVLFRIIGIEPAEIFKDGCGAIENGGLLVEQHHIRDRVNRSGKRFQHAANQLEQGRFAGAIGTTDGDAFRPDHRETEIANQRLPQRS